MKKCYIIIKELPLFQVYFTSRISTIFDGQSPIELKQRELTPIVIENSDITLRLNIPQLRSKEYTFIINASKLKDEAVNIIEIRYDRNWYWRISEFSNLILPAIVFLVLLNDSLGKKYSISITICSSILVALIFIDFLIKWYKTRYLELRIVTV